jgi:hypothetical protein
MPTLKDKTKVPANVGDPIPANVFTSVPPPAFINQNPAGLPAPGSRGPAPSVWTTAFDSVRQWTRPLTSQIRFPPLPTKVNPQLNAATRSIIAATTTPSTSTTTTVESAYVPPLLFDDFYQTANAAAPFGGATSIIGDLDWYLFNTGANTAQSYGGTLDNLGYFAWSNSGSTKQFAGLIINGATGNGTIAPNGMALLENPGWTASWTFKVDYGTIGGGATVGAFSRAKKSLYIGLSGVAVITTVASSAVSARPDIFLGLRYDTSATPGTQTVTSCANAAGGVTVYTGTFPLGVSNELAGMKFTVAGFTVHPAQNNGTFTCTASSSTTLTLANTAGVAESASATATNSGLQDSFYTFEVVENASYLTAFRNNTQGQTSVTSLAPAADGWHTFTMTCPAIGQVTMTLDALPSITFTVPQFAWTSQSNQLSCPNGMANVNWSTRSFPVGTNPFVVNNPYPPLGTGSVITMVVSGGSTLSGTWTIDHMDNSTPTFNFYTGLTVGTTGPTIAFTAYPSLIPMMTYGNDDSATPTSNSMRFYIDKFSLQGAS